MNRCRGSKFFELLGGLCVFLGVAGAAVGTLHLTKQSSEAKAVDIGVDLEKFVVSNALNFLLLPMPTGCYYEIYTKAEDCAGARLVEARQYAEESSSCFLCGQSVIPSGQQCLLQAAWQDSHQPPLRLIAYVRESRRRRMFNVTGASGAWVVGSCRNLGHEAWLLDVLMLSIGVILLCAGTLLCHFSRWRSVHEQQHQDKTEVRPSWNRKV
ncbi:unnamed protein product [Effrenium voratum]|nr:unnamed protein product [Effrenium voratum]